MLCPRGGREESSVSSLHNGVPRDQCSRRWGIISQNSSQGSVKILWLLGLLLFLILNGFWWFVWGVYQTPPKSSEGAASSSLPSQYLDSYGKYLVIEKIDYKRESIGGGVRRRGDLGRIHEQPATYWTLTATVRNIGDKVASEIEGHWYLIDTHDREHREKIRISRPLPPGYTREISIQVRASPYFRAPGIRSKSEIVFEKFELSEPIYSP